ncbi:MAG: hypothetical protein NW205_14055 [Hyphomicrobiaceae bacterium]|nr:hypothetical protein [Hyphomicrobiaceae bacterium]
MTRPHHAHRLAAAAERNRAVITSGYAVMALLAALAALALRHGALPTPWPPDQAAGAATGFAVLAVANLIVCEVMLWAHRRAAAAMQHADRL